MKYFYSIVAVFLFLPAVVWATSPDEIKRNSNYLWGEGEGVTLADAEKEAMNMIASSISVNLSGSSSVGRTESGDGVKDEFTSVIKTYTQSTLTNTKRIVIENEPDAHVFVYIHKSEVAKMFEGRKKRIGYMVEEGEKALKALNIDNALRNFYWALCLTKSLQYPNEAKYVDADGERILISWLPDRITNVMNNISVDYCEGGVNGNDVKVNILYKGEPVNTMDYTYFDGRNWSYTYSANSGVGLMELREGTELKNLKLKCEYEYESEAHIDSEIQNVTDVIKPIVFREAYKQVVLREKSDAAEVDRDGGDDAEGMKAAEVAQGEEVESANSVTMVEVVDDYKSSVDRLIGALQSKQYASVENMFTAEGYEIYKKLLMYGKAKVVDSDNVSFVKNGEDVQCRGVLAHFNFKSNRRKFIEDLCITFNEYKLISNISFGLGAAANKDILTKDHWEEKVKLILINFLETYKTAYALKRIDYIENVFHDDAIIITGTMFKKYTHSDATNLNKKAVKYSRRTKAEYIKGLKYSFGRNEYINIRFANNDIMKLTGAGENVYGIQIKQDYYSTTYGDSGYLFLVVNLNDPDLPIITVRTWQPNRDPEFGKDGLIGAEHF